LSIIETRARLLATSALCAAALVAVPAIALADTATATTTAAQSPTTVSEVIVTGTHIPKANLEQPAPVAVIPQQMIVDSPDLNLGTIIAQLPAMSAQGTVRSNANSFGTSGGLDFADLRNLGPNRTLVLVDGKRHVPGDPNSEAVDLSSIPPALVDRVEVVTGGASAIYGSDALAGVVNIILKKRFEGIQVDAQVGALQEGGTGSHYGFDATIGHTFLNDHLNVAVTGIYDHQDAVNATSLHALRNYGTIVNPADEPFPGANVPIPNDGIPDFIIVPNVLSNGINGNGVLVDLVPILFGGTLNDAILNTFNNAGQSIPQQLMVGFNSFAFGSFPNGCATCFGTESYESIIPETTRGAVDLRVDYDVTNQIRFTLDAKYVNNHVQDFVQPSFTFFQDFLYPNNAFITPALAAQLAPVFALDNAFGIPGPFINRFLTDLGNRTEDITRETYRVVADLEGTTNTKYADLTWDVSYNYGTTRNHLIAGGNRISGNFEAALQSVIDPATGKPACEMNVPAIASADPFFNPPSGLVGDPASCVPYNPFGQQNSQAAINYITRPLPQFESIDQQVADIGVNFDTSRFFNLPGGPIGFAAGGEWRRESLKNIQDPLVIEGLTEIAPTPNAFGSFSVYEGYIEANAPILKHQFLADELSIDGAYRIAHYSTVGTVDAWKVSGVYGPFDWIKFRGTYSRAVRAPNLTEAFLPPTGTFFTVSDPCDAANIGTNVNYVVNCAAAGIPPGFVANVNVSPPGEVTGNADLKPERSISYTVGMVLQPKMVPNLSVTVDYYDIKIKDAISLIAAQDILNNCYGNAAGLDPTFCSLFTRDPATHDISFITSTYINSVQLQTSGVETQINYGMDVAPYTQNIDFLKWMNGRLTATADINWLYRLRNFPFQTNPTQFTIYEGEVGWPEWKGLFTMAYFQGPWQVDWQMNWISESDRYNKSPGNSDPADQIFPLTVGQQWTHNVVIHYITPLKFGGNTTKADFYFGINDLLDAQPPPDVVQGNPTGPDGSALYPLGREFFGGVRARF
jgi:outer membrane receptor protein involved in Fe transport